jgi:phosphonate transport system substrate-binding protein
MTPSSPATPESQPAKASTSPKLPSAAVRIARAVLYLGLAAAVGAVAYAYYQTIEAKSLSRKSQDSLVHQYGVTEPVRRQLAAGYTDTKGRLLADPPSDPARLLNPETILVAYDEDSDLDVQPIAWDEFRAHLAQATGRNVEIQEYLNSAGDVEAVRDGRFHVVALHAADAPFLVNNAGLIPVAVVGSEAGAEGNHFDLVASRESKLQKLADVRGRVLTCSMPDSVVGYRAAVAVLLQEAGMRPDIDYTINFSGGQTRSAMGIANGEYEVAALSDDKLRILLGAGRIQENDFRIIYQSKVIPRITIGYVHNLQPELAAKVTEAILDFENAGGPVDEDGGTRMRFIPTDYKLDFEFVRMMDERFEPRLRKE